MSLPELAVTSSRTSNTYNTHEHHSNLLSNHTSTLSISDTRKDCSISPNAPNSSRRPRARRPSLRIMPTQPYCVHSSQVWALPLDWQHLGCNTYQLSTTLILSIRSPPLQHRTSHSKFPTSSAPPTTPPTQTRAAADIRCPSCRASRSPIRVLFLCRTKSSHVWCRRTSRCREVVFLRVERLNTMLVHLKQLSLATGP